MNYIDQIVAQIKREFLPKTLATMYHHTSAEYPSVTVVAVVEPDSLANLVTNLSDPNCANAEAAYKQCVVYAIQQLSTVNVAMYLDAGHAGWLCWPANLQPAATLFSQILQSAGTPNTVRGLATSKLLAMQSDLLLTLFRCCKLQRPPGRDPRPNHFWQPQL